MVMLRALLKRLSKESTRNWFAVLVPLEVVAGSLLQIISGGSHRDIGSLRVVKSVLSPMELERGVWIVICVSQLDNVLLPPIQVQAGYGGKSINI